MAEISYLRLLAEFRKRDNFAAVFRAALEDVAAKVDFSLALPSVPTAENARWSLHGVC